MTRILIVDDSPTEMHVLKSMLEKNGFETITATSGEQGVEVAKAE
ncbi:MAG: response regulator, partial [Gammaproteobacteria bacterium]